jgi:hypothetical protein
LVRGFGDISGAVEKFVRSVLVAGFEAIAFVGFLRIKYNTYIQYKQVSLLTIDASGAFGEGWPMSRKLRFESPGAMCHVMNRRDLEQRSRNQVRKANSTAETRRAQRKTELGAPAESCSKCAVLRIYTAMSAEVFASAVISALQ